MASLLKEECNVDGIGHDIHEHIQVADIDIELTPADHAWQRLFEEYNYRVWEDGECCGFYLRTSDATIWCVGDSKLMACQLHMVPPNEDPFNGNPQNVFGNVVNPERVVLLAPGQEYRIK